MHSDAKDGATRPVRGFETAVLQLLAARINQMPPGTAIFKVGNDPFDERSPLPYFEIIPSHKNSAPIRGTVGNGEGVNLQVGKKARRELWITGGNIIKGKTCEEECLMICEAVFTTSSSEEAICDIDGRVLRSRLWLKVDSIPVLLGKDLLIRWPFTKTRRTIFSYEAYS